MDHDSSPPNLGGMTSTMAANQAKVLGYADVLAVRVDNVVAAACRHDWAQVRQLSGHLATVSRLAGYRAVSAIAQTVCNEASKPENGSGIRRGLIRLIGTCARTIGSETGSIPAQG